MTAKNKANDFQKHSLPVLCVIHPNKFAYSETFIQAHIERLPAKIRVLYGGFLPSYSDDDKDLLPSGIWHRLLRAVLRRLLPLSPEYFQKEALKRFLKKNKVDAVLAEYGQTGTSVMDACLETSVPLVVHFHGYDAFDQRVLNEFAPRYPLLFEKAALIIAASCSMRDQLVGLGAPVQKISVNPYGVDLSLFRDANPETSSPTLVAVGRFVDKKAPHLTLLSFKKVLEQYSEACLIMIGDGELLEACRQIAKVLGMSSSVQFLGVQSSEEITTVFRTARAFIQHSIQTSYGDSESLGVVFLEAGASGLPVVATRHDGIPEVVIDKETGFLVDEGDIDGMAECMLRLLKDPEMAARLGKAAKKRIHDEFNMEKSIGNLWSHIEKVIQS